MSSSSNLSWCTAESDPTILLYDDIRRISMDFSAEAKEFKATAINNETEKAQNTYQSIEQRHVSSNICCCKKIPIFFVQLRKQFTWEIPWFIVMISVAQVCMICSICVLFRFNNESNVLISQ